MTISENRCVSASNLEALRECEKKFYFKEMSLKDVVFEKTFAPYEIMNKIADGLKGGVDIEAVVRSVVKPEWYTLNLQYEKAVDMLTKKFSRMYKYILENFADAKVLHINKTLFTNLSKEKNCKGVCFNSVSNSFKLILQDKSGVIHGILFSSKKPVLSYKARIAANKPENSIKLISAYASLREMYPDAPITVSLYHLTSKDDESSSIAEEFEKKPGKNIISLSFTNDTLPMPDLDRALASEIKVDCSSCRFNDICTFECTPRIPADVDSKPQSVSKQISYTDAQKVVINHIDGPMLVEAVPGAGKTFSLVERVKHFKAAGIPLNKVLIITFTKKACKELQTRIANAITGEDKPCISTFNSFGYTVIKENSVYFGALKLADSFDKRELIEQAIINTVQNGIMISGVNYEYLDGDYGLISSLYKFFEEIEELGEDLFVKRWEDRKDVTGILRVYDEYRKLFIENGYIGFNDQVELVNKLFDENKAVLALYQKKYPYVMVDEFQDINEEQFKLIKFLTEESNNLVAVGDCDQSIYAFRGGNCSFALNFQSIFPNAKVHYMEDNFRCTDKVINAANELISNNTERYDKMIKAHKEGADIFLYRQLPTDGLSRLVNNMQKKYSLGDIAIISRKNSVLEKAANLINIGSALKSKDYIIEDCVFLAIKDILALAYGDSSDKVLYRALKLAGADTISRNDTSVELYLDLLSCGLICDFKCGFDGAFKNNALWNASVKLSQCIKVVRSVYEPSDALSSLLNIMWGISSHLVVDNLLDAMFDRDLHSLNELFFLMCSMVRFNATTRVGYDGDSTHLNFLTAHDSKGKEFPCVILYGIEEFLSDPEERRLLYVAMTRAKETLIVIQNSITGADTMLSEFSAYTKELVMRG